MKTKLLKTLVVAVVAAMLFSTQTLYAQSTCGTEGPGANRKGKMGHLIEKLDLSPEQQEQIKEQRKGNKEGRKELFNTMRDKNLELREELKKSDSDQAKISSIVSELKELQGEMIDQRVDSFLEMKEILTPEQFQQFVQFTEEARQRRKGRQSGRSGSGRGGFGRWQ